MGGESRGRLYAFSVAALIILVIFMWGGPSKLGVPLRGSGAKIPERMKIAIIADLDKKSRAGTEKKPKWFSYIREGVLAYDSASEKYSVTWEEKKQLWSKHGEAGRGMELSELVAFNGKLFTCDDRSGILFEISPDLEKVFPRALMMEGNGDTDKGFKCEWITVKDNKMYVGSMGKEYTLENGTIKNRNNMWVMMIDSNMRVSRENWNSRYVGLRDKAGFPYPGYLLHEAVVWSPALKRWVIFPRRVSKEAYSEEADEKKGSNLVLVASEDWSDVVSHRIGNVTPERGFSSAKEVPGSQGTVFVALKSMENEEAHTQGAFITVVGLDGKVLLPETPIPEEPGIKYEGIEFLAGVPGH